jgi:lipooligosaccharide transport system permease protein
MSRPPGAFRRILAVWSRHRRCYFKHLLANGLPPFLEPLLFIFAMGFGLGRYVSEMEGMSFIAYIAPAMMATSSFYTASYETTYGTFIRMEYQKTYFNILATPVTFRDLFFGELLWCGTKGFMFSACVLGVISCFGLVEYPPALLTPFVGFLNAVAFGALGLFVTGFTRSINNFNLYFTGFLTPMFFFSGTFFPVSELPASFQKIAVCLPLTHTVALMRGLAVGRVHVALLSNLLLLVLIPLPFMWAAFRMLRQRMIV